MNDQISRLSTDEESIKIRASIIKAKAKKREIDCDETMDDAVDVDISLHEQQQIRNGYYHIVFAHPETLISDISSAYGRELLLSTIYQENVAAIVVDEAHCVVEWGSDFRKDYGKLGVLCAMFPDVPCLAMTATASRADMKDIQDSLGLKKCSFIVANPDRTNIFYQKLFRHGQDAEAIKSILMPIANGLLELKYEYPLTIVYVPLRLCGFVYKLFEYVLGVDQYFPRGSAPTPENRLFAQFHAPQTNQMKDEILKQLCSKESTIRVVFATVAIGMGVDIPYMRLASDNTCGTSMFSESVLSRNWTCWQTIVGLLIL